MSDVKRIGVVGAGSMGTGIAHLAALSGFQVTLTDTVEAALGRALGHMRKLMDRSISKGKLTPEQMHETLARISVVRELEAMAEADFVIEAIIEDQAAKQDLFTRLDKICRTGVVLATNTSSISITSIAAATGRPERVVGMHFFNPPQVMRLVEVVRGYETSDATVAETKALAERMRKTTVEVKRDTPGFIVNRVMIPQLIEAIRLVEEGVASKEDVDTAVKLGLNYPMGPFELQDFAGVDIGLNVMDVFYNEMKDPRYAAPQSLRALVRAGRLGKKVKKGWYDYGDKD
ncbi:MAG: 3-hydroxyacyl-CoA dehydrogenase family protein [Alicyclobacillus herbarius]|uniref:3-hydroxyacyl-CoA dehydrogenase family protein n=1 Tax=Alicyclobacillus herbarius TaxID=122960 RepID=UPI00235312EF|nr:3-hydroxyacyl-CoA dehydrogenase family protein [Alicyclobacillus herbarius]MCL6633401.1 3-hydroxyacyl-CoA dehydrogenase family protein [Alicyclobacillus herbarius]